MKQYLSALTLLLGGYLSATTVTGTIQDINGNRYANGTVSAFNLITGASMTPGATDANGSFSITLSPSTYLFTVCARPVNIGPSTSTSVTQVCSQPAAPIVISGGSQDVSTQINAVAPILGPSVAALLGANNIFTGSNTHTGPETFNGLVSLTNILTGSGSAAIAGTFGGSPTMTGAWTFSGGGSLSGTWGGSPITSGNWTMQGSNSFTGSNTFCLINNAYVAGSSCYATIQAAITAAGTLGQVLIPSNYAGADTYTNPNSIVIDDRRPVIAGTGFNYNNVGFWQNSQNTSGINSIMGACNPQTQFQLAQTGINYFTSALTGCAQPPTPPKSVWQAAGVTGFCNATDNTNCVGVYGQGYADVPTPYTVSSSSCSANVVTFSLSAVPQIASGTQVLIASISGIGAGVNGLFTLASGAYNTSGPFTYSATCTNGTGSGGTLKAGAKAWGMNCWVGGQAGSSPIETLQCLEADANPPDATVTGNVIDVNGAFAFTTLMNGFGVGAPIGGGKWNVGFYTAPACCNQAIYVGPIALGNSQSSGVAVFQGTNSGGTAQSATLQASANGDFVIAPQSGFQTISRGAVLSNATVTAGNYAAYAGQNDSTGANTSKSVSFDFYGRDTVNSVKMMGSVRALPGDTNDTAASLSFQTRTSDTVAEAAILSGTGTLNLDGTTPQLNFGGKPMLVNAIPTITGTGACATSGTSVGEGWAGRFTCTGVTAASTVTLTFAVTATNAYRCSIDDETTANALRQTGQSATTCIITGTVNQNDVLTFNAFAY